jgi:lactate 2-monooxygenase
VVEDVLAEFDLTLGLTGHTRVDQISPDVLRRVAERGFGHSTARG